METIKQGTTRYQVIAQVTEGYVKVLKFLEAFNAVETPHVSLQDKLEQKGIAVTITLPFGRTYLSSEAIDTICGLRAFIQEEKLTFKDICVVADVKTASLSLCVSSYTEYD